ncbi:Response regulator of zinc sigma-54-dependent two-component system [Klebsiella pneumoniae]|nr:Response regulator of zinc sigma-54-dependent two-component system [Klebsiella pneumoniae]
MSSDKVQILVVDDDVSHCTILQALLRGWGYQVGLAHNGLQALEQIHQQVFDLVLCDIRMAEMDGIATLKESRNSSAMKKGRLPERIGGGKDALSKRMAARCFLMR